MNKSNLESARAEVKKFSERDCKKGKLGILSKGTELMPKLIK